MENSTRGRLIQASTLGAGAVLGLALLVLVNYLGARYYKRFDWTSSEIYTLSEKSLNVVAGLEKEVEATVLMSPADPLFEAVRELLSRYDAASPRFTVRVVDPEKNLAETRSLVERYELAQLNVVVFSGGGDRRIVDGSDLADYDYSGVQFGQAPEMTGFKGEQVFTSTLLELAETEKPKVLFTTGHGELELTDFGPQGLNAVREAIEGDNFEVEPWASLGQPAVPEGVGLVVIAGPTAAFVEPEVEALGRYLAAGGRLLVLVDPALSTTVGGSGGFGLDALLADWGVELGADVVIDPANPIPFYGAETIYVESYGSHAITRSLDQQGVPVILPLVRSVRAAAAAEGLEVTELLRTSAEGWGETALDQLDSRVERGEGDLEGPVPVAVAVRLSAASGDGGELEPVAAEGGPEGEPGAAEPVSPGGVEGAPAPAAPRESRMVVIGDADFASNGQVINVGNAELLLNTINWLTERENLVGIAAKKPEQVRLRLTAAELRSITLLVFLALPGMAILAGTAVFFRRRR